MDSSIDHYSCLGVMPNAEQIVITAAYRALARQYHPDLWKGDPAIANRRMAEINVAYGVIGDPDQRQRYDKTRDASHSTFSNDTDDMEQAFDQAMSDLEGRWQTACKIFPDLAQIRKHLAKTAHRLAFAFVTLILETKEFNHRQQLADRLEQKFLELHFGTNQDIVLLAKKLIALGHKKAIVALNEYVDVLGSNIDANPLITKIYADFNINAFESEIQKSNEARQQSQHASNEAQIYLQSLRKYRKYWDAEYLLKLLGYEIEEIGQGVFMSPLINIYKKNQSGGRLFIKEFSSKGALVIWAIETIEL
jgi:hypothetical protein